MEVGRVRQGALEEVKSYYYACMGNLKTGAIDIFGVLYE